jgi:hypothetical protein
LSGDNFPVTLAGWMRKVDRRLELLERRRQHRGAVRAVTVLVPFAAGRATVALPAGAAAGAVVAGFGADGPAGGIGATFEAGSVRLRAAVADGEHEVTLIFAPLR